MKKLLKLSFAAVVIVSSLHANGIEFTKETRGVIRDIKLYEYPQWASKITFHNHKEAYFCSPKSMLEFFYKPNLYKKFDAFGKEDIQAIQVTDYNTLNAIDATKAYYVYGTNKISPAGDDLPSFETKEAAQAFADKHHGRRVFSFKEISLGLINLLNGTL